MKFHYHGDEAQPPGYHLLTNRGIMGEPSVDKKKFHIDSSLVFQALLDNNIFSFYVKDMQGKILFASKKMVSDLGFSSDSELVGKDDVELFGEEYGLATLADDRKVVKTGEPILGKVECYENGNGKENWVSTIKLPIHAEDGKIVGLIGITNEINELRLAEQELERMATHDPLTSLPNRSLLHTRILNAIEIAKEEQKQFGLLFLDLDNFKAINDQFGHAIGDQILVDIARVLEFSVRSADTVARYGGDEFIILLVGISDEEKIRLIAEKILNNVADYFRGLNVRAGASIGASLFPIHGETSEMLIKAADSAMYIAKEEKRSFRWAPRTKA